MKFMLIFICLVFLQAFSCAGISNVERPACGDGICDEQAGESPETCPSDCVSDSERRVALSR